MFASNKECGVGRGGGHCSVLVAQLVEHKICDLRVSSSSKAVDTGRKGPVAKWVPGIWTRLVSWLFNQHL